MSQRKSEPKPIINIAPNELRLRDENAYLRGYAEGLKEALRIAAEAVANKED